MKKPEPNSSANSQACRLRISQFCVTAATIDSTAGSRTAHLYQTTKLMNKLERHAQIIERLDTCEQGLKEIIKRLDMLIPKSDAPYQEPQARPYQPDFHPANLRPEQSPRFSPLDERNLSKAESSEPPAAE